MKLDTRTTTVEIGGEAVRVGKLTLGAAVEIESFLETVPGPLDKLERSGVLNQVKPDGIGDLLDKLTAQSQFWPPDAIGALCDKTFLTSGKFGHAFVSAMIRTYNPGLTDDDIKRIASRALTSDVYALQPIALLGVNPDPKDESGLGVATLPSNAPNGGASSPG